MLLLRSKADINATDSIGRSPLVWAEAKDHQRVLAAIQAFSEWQQSKVSERKGAQKHPIVTATYSYGDDDNTGDDDASSLPVTTVETPPAAVPAAEADSLAWSPTTTRASHHTAAVSPVRVSKEESDTPLGLYKRERWLRCMHLGRRALVLFDRRVPHHGPHLIYDYMP